MPEVRVGASRVECDDDQPVLDALLRSGVWMPNSCNQGTCGTCKVRLLAGEVDHRDSPTDTLTDDERAAGMALACQATPRTDVEVAAPGSDPDRRTHPLRDLVATVVEVHDVARDTRVVVLGLDEPLAYSAGQYVEVVVPGRGARRQYSIANPPGESRHLELHVRRVPGGVASDAWVFGTLAVGDRVEASGPLGDFHLADEPDGPDDGGGEPMVLVGGGTGLAPLKAIVLAALARQPDREVVLYHGVRAAADLYDLDLYADLAARHPGFRFVPVLSEETGTGHREGFPTDAFTDDVETGRGRSGWLCGPPAMVDAGVRAFKRRRMAPRMIHREKFTPADALGAGAGIDIDTREQESA
jgi:NAD(P)H-flavin reductase/ferredoxin